MSSKVRIAARLRPRLDGEVDDEQLKVDEATSSITVPNPRDPREIFRFPFSSAYPSTATQEQIFKTDVEPLLSYAFQGVTVTIFAYGVTSSGKTHTMQGTEDDPGVIPRVVEWLFAHSAADASLSMSYMEIYKDEAYDLLISKQSAHKLPIRETPQGTVYVANLTLLPLPSITNFHSLFTKALQNRSVGSTLLNRSSSRSHAVLTIQITIVDKLKNTTLTGKVNLVDLAGSENNKHTGNDPSRMAESAAINKSLSALGQVVHALNKGAQRIPYRDSKLTRILQDALGGKGVGLLICNVMPGVKFRQDVLNTLNFAVRTKNVENRVVVDERDNRLAPKPHFAALTTIPTAQVFTFAAPPNHPQMPPAPPQESQHPTDRRDSNHAAKAGKSRRHSLLPQPVASVRSSLSSTAAFASALQGVTAGGSGMSAKEIDERISKAVEAEVQRRLAERERELEERERKILEASRDSGDSSREGVDGADVGAGGGAAVTIAPGILTPLINRQRDMDQEVWERLQELERKYEMQVQAQQQRSQSHSQSPIGIPNSDVLTASTPPVTPPSVSTGSAAAATASTATPVTLVGPASSAGAPPTPYLELSPVSRKKTGRAYVALARAHSDKGDLRTALTLYRKAEAYVPNNVKLKERIIDIEWAVANGKPFVPSPRAKTKAARKDKDRRSSKRVRSSKKDRDSEDIMQGRDGESESPETDTESRGMRPFSTRSASEQPMSEDQMDVDEVAGVLDGGVGEADTEAEESSAETDGGVKGGNTSMRTRSSSRRRGGAGAGAGAGVFGAELTNIKEEEEEKAVDMMSPAKKRSRTKSKSPTKPTRSSPRKKRTLVDAFSDVDVDVDADGDVDVKVPVKVKNEIKIENESENENEDVKVKVEGFEGTSSKRARRGKVFGYGSDGEGGDGDGDWDAPVKRGKRKVLV